MDAKVFQYKVFLSLILVALETTICESSVSKCPGEGSRYGDFKCDHDGTHRVCAKLVDNSTSCTELSWNDDGKSFWDITGQQRWNWKEKICSEPNTGDSWCICMWATASLIKEVGCGNVHIHCESTDVAYVMSKYTDGGVDLKPAKDCLESKCKLVDGEYVMRLED